MLYYLKKIRGIDMAAVKTVSLTKEYSNGEHYLRAVDDISFTVEENEFVAIMGSSGCGKTTLLNLLVQHCLNNNE